MLGQLQERVAKLKAEASASVNVLVAIAKGPVQAAAAQVLDVTLGFATLHQTTSQRAPALPPGHPGIVKLAQMASKPPEELQQLAGDLFARRNDDGAYSISLEELDSEVENCKGMIAVPEIKQKYKWEAWVIENYDAIKQAFPAQFGLQG